MDRKKVIDVQPGREKIGWVGTGVMGRSMCQHLLDAGFRMTVFNRTRPKAECPTSGDGQLGTHALQKSLAAMSEIDWESR
jgi:3-hydroxyisobutyrate dehydrogenase-like beta-hydroxyacid dehydrogenase